MRADRLLSLLMLLQSRGRMTAQALAAELEVSVRTIYRDVEALSLAGVPVYADRGPGGGCALLDNYRTTLNGIEADEARALFMLSASSLLPELGLGPVLRQALLKLRAALPDERQHEADWVSRRIYLDWTAWQVPAAPASHVAAVQQAVWEDRKLRLRYRIATSFYRRDFEKVVDACALVAKAGAWYVVAGEERQLRVYAVAELLAVEVLPEHFVREAAFDLAGFWRAWCASQAAEGGGLDVTLRVAPAVAADVPLYFGGEARNVTLESPVSGDDWPRVQATFASLEQARAVLLACGGAVEVLEPPGLRLSIADFARQIIGVYSGGEQTPVRVVAV